MLPTGYRPIRIARTEPRITRGRFLACLALFILALNIAEYFYPSL
jgi:hypothetical protein